MRLSTQRGSVPEIPGKKFALHVSRRIEGTERDSHNLPRDRRIQKLKQNDMTHKRSDKLAQQTRWRMGRREQTGSKLGR